MFISYTVAHIVGKGKEQGSHFVKGLLGLGCMVVSGLGFTRFRV